MSFKRIRKLNRYFVLVGFYKESEKGGVSNTEMVIAPAGFMGMEGTFDEFIAKPELLEKIKFRKVEAKTLEEFAELVDQEEQRLIRLINKKGVAA